MIFMDTLTNKIFLLDDSVTNNNMTYSSKLIYNIIRITINTHIIYLGIYCLFYHL